MKKFLKSLNTGLQYTVFVISAVLGFLGVVLWIVSPIILTAFLVSAMENILWSLLLIPIITVIVTLILITRNKTHLGL